jgi:8-oxo-dGTP pyrophosphatase MutT (NUDIX family)
MFKLKSNNVVLKTRPFNVEEVRFEVGDLKPEHSYFRLNAPDWVNVLPVTMDNKIILVRQPRIGSLSFVLETPGGVMDAHEKDPTLSAARELEEETGFVSQRFVPLGSINPNPAIMTNRCHFFVALGCAPASNRKLFPDEDERVSVEFFKYKELDALIRTGQVNHALACLCITLAGRYIKDE